MSIPSHMKAIVIEGTNAVPKDNVPLPSVKEGFVLIRTLAVAVNPTDWKHVQLSIGPQGSICGCDASGQVIKVGPNVEDIKEGDFVSGIVHGASVKHPDNGAFAQYAVVDSKLLWKFKSSSTSSDSHVLSGKNKLPEGPVTSLEGLVTFPVSLNTAGIVLFRTLKMDLNWKSSDPQRDEPVIVWGGATAFGQCFIQLAKLLNAFNKIVVVASRKHEPLLAKYGADELFDYHDPDVIDQIKKEYPEAPLVVDGVSASETYDQIYRATANTKPSVIINLTYLGDKNVQNPKPNVKHESTMLYMATGEDAPVKFFHFPKNLEYRRDVITFIKWAQAKIDSGEIHHMPIEISKGLQSIPDLMERIRTGKNSGVKLVATI